MSNIFQNFDTVQLERIKSNLLKNRSFCISGLSSFLRLLLLKFIAQESKVLFLVNSEQKALKYKNDLNIFFSEQAEILPYQDISLYDELNSDLYKYARQVDIIENLDNENIIIAPIKTLLEKFPDKTFYEENSISLKVDDEIDVKKLEKQLVELGYKRTFMVVDIGEFSVRGDIIDIYNLEEAPVRIELWGDTVVDIRYFNPNNQRSFEKLKAINILPLYKFILQKDKEKLLKICDDTTKEKLENEGYFEGIEYFQDVLSPDLSSFCNILPKDWTVILDESSELFSKFSLLEENFQKQAEKKTFFNKKISNYLTFAEFRKSIGRFKKVYFNNFIDDEFNEIIDFESTLVPNFSGDILEIINYIQQQMKNDYKFVISTDYQSRMEEFFKEFAIDYTKKIEDFKLTKNRGKNILLIPNLSLSGGIIEDLQLCAFSDKELFNKKSKDITISKHSYNKENIDAIESIADIKEGDYVVHQTHGIGRYLGLTKQEIDGELKDYLSIEYHNKDKLHIPAEQVNMLSRYRATTQTNIIKLSKMGGNDWDLIKSKVKKAVEDIAADLIRLYAQRKKEKGIEFLQDTPWQYEMEEAFEFIETPDQMKSIDEVKNDMESANPMDRLICGDVGFGKTEVAIRAIFKAIMSGYQVAVIAPTTILALQHYQTIFERFKPFSVKVELLSRFKSAKEQKQVIQKLQTGECDVVIATHRILQKDIFFKKLGLLIIDEEHRFGVKDKEKLKMMKKNIDILSMSATPIPRTLYMSLSGIKSMSVINTAPKNRLPIKTVISEFNEDTLKKAVLNELDRDGQIFFLYNRVETIYEFASKLREILPNIRIAVAHGQMSPGELEKTMVEFEQHEYDILLCTTIIESGLDIPNANTMLVYDAHKLGLAQLYQIRGRVGRSERQAYCYCFYKDKFKLSQEASERLEAIKSFTTLGSGYQIALRDIEIRGVGNILGTKQHGHMVNVGFDTYCQLLEEAVLELQGEKPKETCHSVIDINITAFIPDEWVGSKEQKIVEYKRLADVNSTSELDLILSQWKDRFSKLPVEVENLAKLVRLRILASDANIPIVRQSFDNIRIYTPYQRAEWSVIKFKADKEIVKYIKFTDAPKTCKEAKSILLLDTRFLNFEQIYAILSDLFCHIFKLRYNYHV